MSCALSLEKGFRVTVFDSNLGILEGASYGNQNRSHRGYHYPRSAATARECLESAESFRRLYGPAMLTDFPNYYFIASRGSKTSPEGYLGFCDEMGLDYKREWPARGQINRDLVSVSLRVTESVIDISKLRKVLSVHIRRRGNLKVRLGTRVTGGRIQEGGTKRLVSRNSVGQGEEDFDFVVNCTYSNMNAMCGWFGFKKKLLQNELCEIPIVTLPNNARIGLTVMDGPFCSILPEGSSGDTLVYHVKESVLDTQISESYEPRASFASNFREASWREAQISCQSCGRPATRSQSLSRVW